MQGKLVILSAPSGAGKTTIMRRLLERFEQLEFSISATSRPPRGQEKDGVDYYFFTPKEFSQLVYRDAFVEWEEVYQDTCYGTLFSETERIWAKGHTILFDVDVLGGLNLKAQFGDRALALFVMPPSLSELRRRLVARGTESPEKIEQRIRKAEYEMSYSNRFDQVVVNDELDEAVDRAAAIIEKFLA